MHSTVCLAKGKGNVGGKMTKSSRKKKNGASRMNNKCLICGQTLLHGVCPRCLRREMNLNKGPSTPRIEIERE